MMMKEKAKSLGNLIAGVVKRFRVYVNSIAPATQIARAKGDKLLAP